MAPVRGGVVIQRVRLTPGCILHRELREDEDREPYVHDVDVQDHRGVSCWDQLDDDLADWIGDQAPRIDAFGGRQFWAGRREELEEAEALDLAGGV